MTSFLWEVDFTSIPSDSHLSLLGGRRNMWKRENADHAFDERQFANVGNANDAK